MSLAGIEDLEDKLKFAWIRCYGRVQRREENLYLRKAADSPVTGKGKRGKSAINIKKGRS